MVEAGVPLPLYTGVPIPALPFVRCMILGKSLTFSKLLPIWKKGLVKYLPYRVAVKYQKANIRKLYTVLKNVSFCY